MGNAAKVYKIGKRSITAGSRVHSAGKVVTAASMGIDGDAFASLIRDGRVVDSTAQAEAEAKAKKEADEKAVAAIEAQQKKEADALVQGKQPQIVAHIKALCNDKGEPLNADDFTATGLPSVPALELSLKGVDGFAEGISADERDDAWDAYKADLAKAAE